MELTEKHVEGLKELLYKMADDQLIIGHRNSEWTGLGPILEEDIAFSSMAQDKIGQSYALFELLNGLGENEPDIVAFTRNSNQFHNCQLVEFPIGEYDFSLVRHFYFDHAEALRFEALMDSSFEPLSMIARKYKGEIKYHTLHADSWLKILAKGTEESFTRIQNNINEFFPHALGIFEQGDYEKELIEADIFIGEDALRSRWYEKISGLLTSFGYTVPALDSVTPIYGGRKGVHTPSLQPLLDEMTEVFSIDPTAEW